jgi:hypothetical protein
LAAIGDESTSLVSMIATGDGPLLGHGPTLDTTSSDLVSPSGTAPNALPEPNAIMLLALGGLLFMNRRRA